MGWPVTWNAIEASRLVGHGARNEAAMPAGAAGDAEGVGRDGHRVAVGIVEGAAGGHVVGAAIRTDRDRLQVRLGGGGDRAYKRRVVVGDRLDSSSLDGIGDGLHVGAAGLLLAVGDGAKIEG